MRDIQGEKWKRKSSEGMLQKNHYRDQNTLYREYQPFGVSRTLWNQYQLFEQFSERRTAFVFFGIYYSKTYPESKRTVRR